MKIILGSESKGRKIVLTRAGYTFTTMPAAIDEKAIRSDDYHQLPLMLARAKAAALIPKITDPVLLITSDQVVVWNGELREKPESIEQARHYLATCHSAPSQTNTAVVVTNTATGEQYWEVDIARVYFSQIPSDVIEQIIAKGDIMNAAGGYIVEDEQFKPYIIKIEGEIDSITGLPLILTKQLLAKAENSRI